MTVSRKLSERMRLAVEADIPRADFTRDVVQRAERAKRARRYRDLATTTAAVFVAGALALAAVPSLRSTVFGVVHKGPVQVLTEGAGDPTAPPVIPNGQPANALPWQYRGTLPVEVHGAVDARAYSAWAGKQGATPDRVGGIPLLGVTLPSGTNVFVGQVALLSEDHSNNYSSVVYTESTSGSAIAGESITPSGARELVISFADGSYNYSAVLSAPGRFLSYASDGQTYLPVRLVSGAISGDGWAVVPHAASGLSRVRLADCASCTPFFEGPV